MTTLKHIAFAAAVALMGTTAAHAEADLGLQHFGAAKASTTTRADVRDQVLKMRAAGEPLVPPEADIAGVFQKAPALQGVTRAQRRAEVLQAQADGSLRASEIELNDRPVASTRSREDVRKEAVAATRSGQAARVHAGY